MAKDNGVIAPRLIFSFGKGAAEVRGHSQHVEIIRRNSGGRKRLRFSLRGRQTDSAVLVRGGDIRENIVGFAPRKVIWRRDGIRVGEKSSSRINGSNHGHAIR